MAPRDTGDTIPERLARLEEDVAHLNGKADRILEKLDPLCESQVQQDAQIAALQTEVDRQSGYLWKGLVGIVGTITGLGIWLWQKFMEHMATPR